MRRICCFCETWESGGIESFLNNVFLHMDLTDMEVDIVATCIKESVFTSGLKELGIKFFELSGNRNQVIENRRLFQKLLRERNYDLIHLNAFHGGELYYLRLAEKSGVPVRIAHSHCAGLRNGALHGLKMMIHDCSRLLFLRSATERWACSGKATDFLFAGLGRQKQTVRIIPNGIDVEKFRMNPQVRESVRKELGLSDRYVIGHVGRLSPEKNQIFLLRVFVELQKRRPDSALLLVGDGDDRKSLEEESEKLQIADSVLLYGMSEQVEHLLWVMDVFAFPSLFEGLGLAAVEAQAAGLPVVCSDRVPSEAAILPLTKFLPLECGLDKWAEALLDYGKSEEARGQDASALIAKGFDISEVSEKIRLFYLRGKETMEVVK